MNLYSTATVLITVVSLLSQVDPALSLVDGLYCGRENCYDVLDVTRESSKSEISKAYRKLAKQFHPDRHQDPDAKEQAEERFKVIATAYETLKDEESRSDYDYMLDNPEEHYRHYYHYYRRRMSPKVDVRIVILVTISVISVLQYYTASFRWSSGMRYLATQTKYRKMALEVAEDEGLLDDLKKMKKRNKEEIKAEEERIIKQVLENKMDIRGGYARPSVQDVLWVQLICSPYYVWNYLVWYATWVWKFDVNKQEYGEEEKFYIIRKFMGMSATQFEAVPEQEKEEFLELELWKKSNFCEWKAEKEEEYKRQMAESGRMKSYRRYMKKHGAGRMYFDDS